MSVSAFCWINVICLSNSESADSSWRTSKNRRTVITTATGALESQNMPGSRSSVKLQVFFFV